MTIFKHLFPWLSCTWPKCCHACDREGLVHFQTISHQLLAGLFSNVSFWGFVLLQTIRRASNSTSRCWWWSWNFSSVAPDPNICHREGLVHLQTIQCTLNSMACRWVWLPKLEPILGTFFSFFSFCFFLHFISVARAPDPNVGKPVTEKRFGPFADNKVLLVGLFSAVSFLGLVHSVWP